jgi:hypothetical protein
MSAREIYEDACAAARRLSMLEGVRPSISLGTAVDFSVLAQLSTLSGARIERSVHAYNDGSRRVFERVEWTEAGVCITATGIRPARAEDEALRTYVFEHDFAPVVLEGGEKK